MHRCPNRACPSRGLETLIHWVSAAMDIEGVGEQFVRRLWDEGLLRSMPDLYRLTAEQLARARRLRRDLRRRARSPRSRRRRRSRSRASSSGSTSRRSAGCWRATSRGTSARRRARRGEPGGARARARGSGPDRAELVAEWFADDENVALVRELASLGLTMTAGRGRATRRRAADGAAVRDHRDARGDHARGGEGGARGARRQGLGLRLEEDDRRDRRREPGLEGSRRPRRPACPSSARPTSSQLLAGLAGLSPTSGRPRVARAGERGHEAVLREPRRPEGDGRAVLEHGERRPSRSTRPESVQARFVVPVLPFTTPGERREPRAAASRSARRRRASRRTRRGCVGSRARPGSRRRAPRR